MALTVVGSIAFDSVRTPFGERERMLGGSAVHFALAASFFTEVRVVGPVGDDFGDEQLAVLSDHGIETADIERVARRRDLLLARPLRARHERRPHRRHPAQRLRRLRAEALGRLARGARCCSSATSSPTSSAGSARECDGARFAALDSMNLWIDTARDALVAAIAEVDCLLLNDAEIRMLTERAEPGPRRARR